MVDSSWFLFDIFLYIFITPILSEYPHISLLLSPPDYRHLPLTGADQESPGSGSVSRPGPDSGSSPLTVGRGAPPLRV